MVSFETFCEALAIEPIGEYLQMFNLFDKEQSGKIDFREYVLGLLNVVSMDRDTRAKFVFQVFDENRSGFITMVPCATCCACR
jgi:Ca2+-binding EF-hand superfamily protein